MTRVPGLAFLAFVLAASSACGSGGTHADVDASASSGDGGPHPADASEPTVDAAEPTVDASEPTVDASEPTVDAAEPTVDASDPPDAMPPPPPPDASPPDASLPPPTHGHPFGTHSGYCATGVILPSNHTQAQLDAQVKGFYDAWKARYIKPGCTAGTFRIKTSPSTGAYTVSEGHGYAMLVLVIMHGHDAQAQQVYDGLFRYFRAHASNNNHQLMAWAQNASCANVDGADSATDGDLDIAYSLLLADKQWGSTGTIDYKAEATAMIAAILASDVHPANTILVGDWSGAGDSHYTGTRPSDFMLGHFKAFAAGTSVARWTSVVDKTYAIIAYIQGHQAAQSGLLPDFVVNATGNTPAPAPGNWLEGGSDGRYAYNSCRVPWRIATDYLMSCDPRAQTAARKINTWVRGATGDNPANVKDGYNLNGSATGSDPDLCFVAPFGVSAMVQPDSGSNQVWLDKVWDYAAAQGADQYYEDSVKLLGMIVMSGNWWSP